MFGQGNIKMAEIHTIVGIITMFMSVLGMVLSTRHYLFYRRARKNILSKRLRNVFITDAMIYGITLVFGLWALFDWGFSAAITFQIIRIPILLLNIVASYRLFILYKHMLKEK